MELFGLLPLMEICGVLMRLIIRKIMGLYFCRRVLFHNMEIMFIQLYWMHIIMSGYCQIRDVLFMGNVNYRTKGILSMQYL